MSTQNKTMHIALWVIQILLAAMFIMAGLMKSTTAIEELGKNLPWVLEMPALARFIGISELLGGLGLVLPSLLRIKPILTPIAGFALTLVMFLAMGFHFMHSEFAPIGVSSIIGAMAAFVAWGRIKIAPISAR
jgi:uncharacterized membrane protein YphA (DoxX/SURF4 family)